MTLACNGKWIEPGLQRKLGLLTFEDRNGTSKRTSIPPTLFTQMVAPFLQFGGPVPDQLYVIGGRDQHQEPLNVVELFDSWHGRWIQCPSMQVRRAGCAAAALPDGRLLVAGGYDERGIVGGVLGSCEVFNPRTQSWDSECAELLRARWGHGCATLGGLVYIVGGCALLSSGFGTTGEDLMETLRTCEVYDASENVWKATASLNVARAGARLVCLTRERLAAVGGCDDVFGRAEMLATIEIFCEGTGKWSLLDTQLGVPRTTAAAVALDEDRIMVMGGAPSLASAEVYHMPRRGDDSCRSSSSTASTVATIQDFSDRDSITDLTQSISDMAEGRMGCQAVTMKLPAPGRSFPVCTRQCVVVVGGENGDEEWDDEGSSVASQFSSVLVFDAEDGTWRPSDAFPALPTPRTAMALCVAPALLEGYHS